MMDMKEVRYFVACVETESFSKAAEILFTTQSSVSKVIKSMEEEIGGRLFERLPKGIRMTQRAEYIYPYALEILENVQKMQIKEKNADPPVLCLSFNPSSWFADTFVKYYELHQAEEVHYQIYSADSREIVDRVRERKDDLGFVYVMKNQLAAFQYYLSRNYLEFLPLKETKATVYPGGGFHGTMSGKDEINFSELKLIQRFPDEFSPDNYWNISDSNGRTAAEAETVITTNSDYIMERILLFSDLVNISGAYLAGAPVREISKGVPFGKPEADIQFGCLKRKEELSGPASGFLDFLSDNLNELQ